MTAVIFVFSFTPPALRTAVSLSSSSKERNPHENRMRVEIANDGRRPSGSPLIGNVRGPSQLKLEKVAQFIKKQRPLPLASWKRGEWHLKGGNRRKWTASRLPTTARRRGLVTVDAYLPTVFTEWAHLAQDHAGWHRPATEPPFAIDKPFARQPRGSTRVTTEDRRQAVAQRAAEIAEIAERRAALNANNNN